LGVAKADGVIVSAQVDPSVRQRLERMAATGYRSLSAEIRRAIDEHVARADMVEPPKGEAAALERGSRRDGDEKEAA
jgi:predicted transcriptional regulator